MSKHKLQRDISNDLKLDVLMSIITGAWFLVMIGLLIHTPTRIENFYFVVLLLFTINNFLIWFNSVLITKRNKQITEELK